MKKTLLLVFCCSVLFKIKAQQFSGNWDTYVIQTTPKPVSVVVDLDFGYSPGAKEKKNVIIVQLNLKQVQPDGMPAREEIIMLDSIENGLHNTLVSALNAQYTGRYTSEGRRDFYFYSNDTSHCRQHLAAVFQQFPVYSWSVIVKRDADLSNYFNVLYPTSKEMERIKNRRMVDVLHAKGDLLTAPRKVEHFLFFKTAADRKNFATVIQDNGFVIENGGKEMGVKDRPYSLHISRADKVDANSIDRVSLYLWELALRYSGKYDGWETFVVR